MYCFTTTSWKFQNSPEKSNIHSLYCNPPGTAHRASCFPKQKTEFILCSIVKQIPQKWEHMTPFILLAELVRSPVFMWWYNITVSWVAAMSGCLGWFFHCFQIPLSFGTCFPFPFLIIEPLRNTSTSRLWPEYYIRGGSLRVDNLRNREPLYAYVSYSMGEYWPNSCFWISHLVQNCWEGMKKVQILF